MINLDDIVNENKTKHNKNWPYIPDHPFRMIIIGGSGSGKTNVLLNLIENQPDSDKIYLYAKDPYECKYQYLIIKRESVGINRFKDLKAFIEYSDDMRNVYKNINRYSPDKENEILIVSHPALRRRGDVAATSLCTSQRRRRYVSNETPNDVSMERREDVSMVRLHDVLLERHNDVSK